MFQSSKDLVKKYNQITKCGDYSMPMIMQGEYIKGSHDIMNFILSEMDEEAIERFSDKPLGFFKKVHEVEGYSPAVLKEAIQMFKRYQVYWENENEL